MIVKGLYKVKQEGLRQIASKYPNIPAVKRHIKNPGKQMEYATARVLNDETGVPIHDIIKMPRTK